MFFFPDFSNKNISILPRKTLATGRPSNNNQVRHLVVHHQVDHQVVVDTMELHHLMEDGKWWDFRGF